MSSLTVKPTPGWLGTSLTEKSPNDEAFDLSLIQSVSKKRYFLDFILVSVPEVGFYFLPVF